MINPFVPFSVLIFFLTGFVLPLVRLWFKTGTFAMAFSRNRDPIQKLVGAAIAFYMTSFCLWAVCYALLGAGALGIWQVPRTIQSIGWAVLVLGLSLTITSQTQMGLSWRMGVDPLPTGLVTTGIFQFSRNPIYTGMLTTLGAYLFLTPCPWLVMGWCQFALLISIQTRYEEEALIKAHGDLYIEYAAKVGRFFPNVGTFNNSKSAKVI
jgi:protein-S-isoprenylcysteine O-methyltransferase Ste14